MKKIQKNVVISTDFVSTISKYIAIITNFFVLICNYIFITANFIVDIHMLIHFNVAYAYEHFEVKK